MLSFYPCFLHLHFIGIIFICKISNFHSAYAIRRSPQDFKDGAFDIAKDIRMAEEADYGFMIWNGKSKGTLNNVINLIYRNKRTLIYFTPNNEFFTVKNLADLERIISQCEVDTRNLFVNLSHKNVQLVKGEIKDYITEEQLSF